MSLPRHTRLNLLFPRALALLAPILLAGTVQALLAGTAQAAESKLSIELNKLEDNDGSCVASVLVENKLGHTLDRFSLDLYVFDGKGVISRQVLLHMAPLRGDKTTVARFALIEGACAKVGKILINNIPSCHAEGMAEDKELDCLGELGVSSLSKIELVK